MLSQEPRLPGALTSSVAAPAHPGHSQALLPQDTSRLIRPAKIRKQNSRGTMNTALLFQSFHFFVMELEPAKQNSKCQAGDFLLQKLANPTVNLSTTLLSFHR